MNKIDYVDKYGKPKLNAQILTDNVRFGVKEAYMSIRVNLNFAFPEAGCKKIIICSPYEKEGKSTTCVNLAITIANSGSNVLLLDCDLRKPNIHNLLGITNDQGVSDFLSNQCKVTNIVNDTHIPSLKVITGGRIPPNPAELLAGARMSKLFDAFSEIFDYIIIDTPPICVVADALPLSKLCDGVIMVVRHLSTTHSNLRVAFEKFKYADANVVGIILNKVKIKHDMKGYYKNKSYYEYRQD
jgi:capsular exopolysaccharide synthesis family protein